MLPCFVGVSKPVDISYLIDISKGTSDETFKKMLRTLLNHATAMVLSKNASRISVYVYPSTPRLEYFLHNLPEYSLEITNLKRLRNLIDTFLSSDMDLYKFKNERKLEYAVRKLQGKIKDGMDRDVANAIVVFVAGKISAAVSGTLQTLGIELKRKQIEIVVIGDNNKVDKKELSKLTSDMNLLLIDFDAFDRTTSQVSRAIGKAISNIAG